MPDLDAPNPTAKGSIAMWSGLIADIPDDWLLCDGTQDTPDYRSKFLRGVPNTSTDPGATGGNDTHALTLTEIPNHTHTVTDPTHSHTKTTKGFSGFGADTPQGTTSGGGTNISTGSTTGLTLNTTGSGTAHENRPSFFELLYIMRGI